MMAGTDTIRKNFEAAAATYADNSGFQRMIAGEVAIRARNLAESAARADATGAVEVDRNSALERAPSSVFSTEPRRILDIGCGTGWLTSALARAFPDSETIGVDIAPAMASRAAAAAKTARFVASDCQALPLRDGSVDVIGSNLTFQWVTDITGAFAEARRVLAPGGLLMLSTLGPGTFAEMAESLESAGFIGSPAASGFADATMVETSLRGAGYAEVEVETRPVRVVYRDIFDILTTLKRIGAAPRARAAGARGLGSGSLLRKAGRIYAEQYAADGMTGVIATYEVIFASAQKK